MITGMTKERLQEHNKKVLKNAREKSPDYVMLRESLKARYGVDVSDAKSFPVEEAGFSWKKVQMKLATKFKEADSETALIQFVRAGVQNISSAWYEKVQTSWQDWVLSVPSKHRTELYAPNHGVAFPREVGNSMIYPEVGVAALDLELVNRKYGDIYALEKELLEDDQTGTFAQQAQLLGEYMALLSEVLVYGKLASVANMQYIDFKIPVSETKPSYETNYPWAPATGSLRGGGVTRPAAFGALTSVNVQAGITTLGRQKNLQGIRMMARPTTLIVGVANEFNSKLILNSGFFPNGASTTANAGTGGFAMNVIQGALDLVVSQFVFKQDGTCDGDSTAWYLASRGKGFVMQLRTPVLVEQENPTSGQSFDRDIYRFKASMRGNADFIDPRFFWQGSDGSA